jgi:hypothetical protein
MYVIDEVVSMFRREDLDSTTSDAELITSFVHRVTYYPTFFPTVNNAETLSAIVSTLMGLVEKPSAP